MRAILGKGLEATEATWPDVRVAFGWVHRAAAVLGNKKGLDGAGVRRRYRGLVAAIAGLSSSPSQAQVRRFVTPPDQVVAIRAGRLFDSKSGGMLTNQVVLVRGDRITDVGPAGGRARSQTPDDAVIDAAGKFILPGLIDAHCHISLHQGALPGVRYTSSAGW